MAESITMKPFDPAAHLSKFRGVDYLEVKWRLVWFRDRYPSGATDTTLVHHDGNLAIFKAEVRALDYDGTMHGSATGYGSCAVDEFAGGYLEKAETKALGRALAALGFGTQFTDDFDDDDNLADAPVRRDNQQRQQAPARNQNQQNGQRRAVGGGGPMSDAQRGKIAALGRNQSITPDEMEELCIGLTATGFDGLTIAGASKVIDHLLGTD